MPVGILIVDDHGVTRDGMAQLLNATPDLRVVGLAPDAATALELAATVQPDVVLLDLRLPDLDGLKVAATLRRSQPSVKIVAITGNEHSEQYARELLRLGVSAYLSKTLSGSDVVSAIRVVWGGGSVFPPNLLRRLIEPTGDPDGQPSARELDVLALVVRGLNNRQIGAELGMSERTVQFHLTNLYSKAQVKSRAALIHIAHDLGWVT